MLFSLGARMGAQGPYRSPRMLFFYGLGIVLGSFFNDSDQNVTELREIRRASTRGPREKNRGSDAPHERSLGTSREMARWRNCMAARWTDISELIKIRL